MLSYFNSLYANSGSSHLFGLTVKEAIDEDLLEDKENFMSREEADQLKDHLLQTAPWKMSFRFR